MSQKQTKTLKMIYKNQMKQIDCPKNANYEECIEIALERFNIPTNFKDFIQISNDSNKIFEKHIFEYYNLLFPSPEIIFFIKIDCEELKNQQQKKKRTPLAELNIKRKRCDANEGIQEKNQKNSSEEILYEVERENSEEPPIKKHKPSSDKSNNCKTNWWKFFLSKIFD